MSHSKLNKSKMMLVSIMASLALGGPLTAQVIIDMPAPKRSAASRTDEPAADSPANSSTTLYAMNLSAQPVVVASSVGDLALDRYAGARTFPRDTYHYASRYNHGYNDYNYYNGWWGWGFPVFGCFGHVGHHGHSHGGGHSHCH